MTTPSNESRETGNSFHLSYNRSGLGCLLVIIGTPLALILFWDFAPKSWILRYELKNQMGRQAYDTVRTAGPSAIPVLLEYLAHEDPRTRLIAVSTAGNYIGYHPEESQSVISALCEKALHDKKKAIQIYAINALRNVRYPSEEIDKAMLILLRSKDEDIRREVESLLLIRIAHEIEISSSLCAVRDQLKPYFDRLDSDSCSAKPLRAFLEKCENRD